MLMLVELELWKAFLDNMPLHLLQVDTVGFTLIEFVYNTGFFGITL